MIAMPIDFLPTLPVALSLAACSAFPVLLISLSHGPARVSAPGRRFVVAAGLTVGLWVGLMLVPATPDAVDVVAGGLLLVTTLLAGFTLWTLVAWGFTLSMLLALGRSGRPLTLNEWVADYTGGRPLSAFARDRLGVLTRLGLADVRGDRVVMAPGRGRLVARVAAVLRRTFGLPS